MDVNLHAVEVTYGSSRYDETLELRREVLRLPLGLDFTPEQIQEERADFHLAIVSPAAVVACLVLTPLSELEIKMRQVAVLPPMQRGGIGTALIKFSEDFAREKGFRRMVLNARDTAVPFYLAQGYDIEGEPFVEVSIPHRHMSKQL